MRERKRIGGYTDLGPISIPALPQPIILTDRDDGTEWVLSWTIDPPAVDGNGYITINSEIVAISRRDGARTYPAFEEPYFGQDGTYRLILRGGNLGYEIEAFEQGIQDNDTAPLYARRNGSRVLRQLFLSDTLDAEKLNRAAWSPDILDPLS